MLMYYTIFRFKNKWSVRQEKETEELIERAKSRIEKIDMDSLVKLGNKFSDMQQLVRNNN